MKRVLISLILAVICTGASAQMHPQIDSLITEIKAILGPRPHSSYRQRLYDDIGTAIREYIWIGKGHGKAEDEKMDKVISCIRRRLDPLAETSSESYRYEYHRNGIDTIQYAINLSGENGRMVRYNGMMQLDGPIAETVSFNLFTDKSGKFSNGDFFHSLRLNDLRTEIDSTAWPPQLDNAYHDSFRHVEFNKMIASLMKRKGVKSHEVHWSDPMPDVNDSNVDDKYLKRFWLNRKDSKGETTGTVYSVSAKDANLANQLLKQLSDSIISFFDANPRQQYTFYLDKDFEQQQLTELLFAQYAPDGYYYDGLYHIYLYCDADTYHFMFLDTRGSLWIPRDF